MAQNFQPRINTDRFGNAYQVVAAEQVVSKQGEALPIFKGYVELGGKLYKLEVSNCNKERKSGKEAKWIKVTAVKKHQRASSM